MIKLHFFELVKQSMVYEANQLYSNFIFPYFSELVSFSLKLKNFDTKEMKNNKFAYLSTKKQLLKSKSYQNCASYYFNLFFKKFSVEAYKLLGGAASEERRKMSEEKSKNLDMEIAYADDVEELLINKLIFGGTEIDNMIRGYDDIIIDNTLDNLDKTQDNKDKTKEVGERRDETDGKECNRCSSSSAEKVDSKPTIKAIIANTPRCQIYKISGGSKALNNILINNNGDVNNTNILEIGNILKSSNNKLNQSPSKMGDMGPIEANANSSILTNGLNNIKAISNFNNVNNVNNIKNHNINNILILKPSEFMPEKQSNKIKKVEVIIDEEERGEKAKDAGENKIRKPINNIKSKIEARDKRELKDSSFHTGEKGCFSNLCNLSNIGSISNISNISNLCNLNQISNKNNFSSGNVRNEATNTSSSLSNNKNNPNINTSANTYPNANPNSNASTNTHSKYTE